MEIFSIIISALIGAVTTFYVPKLLKYLELKRKSKKIFGKWKSAYQDYDGDWLYDDVIIGPKVFGQIRFTGHSFKDKDNDNSATWTTSSKFINDYYLTGEWMSRHKDSNAEGLFSLAVSFHGSYLFGYWVGQNEDHKIYFGAWVMCRDSYDIQDAIDMWENSIVKKESNIKDKEE